MSSIPGLGGMLLDSVEIGLGIAVIIKKKKKWTRHL